MACRGGTVWAHRVHCGPRPYPACRGRAVRAVGRVGQPRQATYRTLTPGVCARWRPGGHPLGYSRGALDEAAVYYPLEWRGRCHPCAGRSVAESPRDAYDGHAVSPGNCRGWHGHRRSPCQKTPWSKHGPCMRRCLLQGRRPCNVTFLQGVPRSWRPRLGWCCVWDARRRYRRPPTRFSIAACCHSKPVRVGRSSSRSEDRAVTQRCKFTGESVHATYGAIHTAQQRLTLQQRRPSIPGFPSTHSPSSML